MSEEKKTPTPGLRLHTIAMEDDLVVVSTTAYHGEEQADIDVTYINWLIETDEKRRELQAKEAAQPSDLIVDMGDLTNARIDRIPLDSDYEAIVEDFLRGYNHVAIQGIPPLTAVYALSQAFAIVLGFALRANMPWAAAQEILKQQMQSATAASRQVKIITKQ